MPAAKGNRIVMINIAVDDLERSRRFYEELMDVELAEERHGDGPLHLNATFGEWNTPSWFLVSLWPESDRAGTVDIGFLVENLDQAYDRALAARATEVYGRRDIQGMPRTAQIKDPAGTRSASIKPEPIGANGQRAQPRRQCAFHRRRLATPMVGSFNPAGWYAWIVVPTSARAVAA